MNVKSKEHQDGIYLACTQRLISGLKKSSSRMCGQTLRLPENGFWQYILQIQSRASRALCFAMYTLGRSGPSENSHLDKNSDLDENSGLGGNNGSDENSGLLEIVILLRIVCPMKMVNCRK